MPFILQEFTSIKVTILEEIVSETILLAIGHFSFKVLAQVWVVDELGSHLLDLLDEGLESVEQRFQFWVQVGENVLFDLFLLVLEGLLHCLACGFCLTDE